MTVCVAAICENGTIFGASDRMLTSGDVKFEPAQPKIFAVTNSIVIMIAGDAATQMDIIYNINHDIRQRIEAKPEEWLNVKDVANLYSKYYNDLRLKKAENYYLAPLGLDRNTFLTQQNQLSQKLVGQLSDVLLNFVGPSVEAIITGVDTTGAHIYVANNSEVVCQDAVGFAAIGIGYWHANSQFMFAGHSKSKPLPETLLLTYTAKKRAEVAPGVGIETDMFILGPNLGSYSVIYEQVLKDLEITYQKIRRKEVQIISDANKGITEYVKKIVESATQKPQESVTKDTAGTQSTNN